ncbi:MAG TPA: chromate transporter, partial [Opitutaceae bacterium]|nr:chromate transporter [Opitutaceae bacterium]
HIEQMRGNARLGSMLTSVTASVVGVVLNLAVWFGWQVIFPAGWRDQPSGFTVDWFALATVVLAFVAMHRFKLGVIPVVLAGGLLGLLHHFVV